MKKILLFIATILSIQSSASSINELLINNPYEASFRKAYSLNPSIPKGVLESVAFTQSRFAQLGTYGQESSCIGYPMAYGVMGLTENGQGYFRNNLVYVSQLSGYSIVEMKSNTEKNILGYAKAFSALQQQLSISGNDLKSYQPIFIALSELPLLNDLQNDFAMNAHLYQLYWFLSNGEFQDFYGFPDYLINLPAIFGDNYDVLSSSSVIINKSSILNNSGASYRSSGIGNAVASTDYGPAIWNPTTCNYSSRSGTAISMVAIHDVEGSYAGCISWFKNCSASASAHYVVRSSDGQVTQMVYESDKAWHIGSENPYTLGIEHEGYASTGYNWYTAAMLTSSSNLVRDMCTSHGINPLRCYFGPGCSGTTAQCQQGTCVKIKGHQMFPNQTHSDPGPYWNWDLFYKLLNNTPTTTTITTTSGTFYDTGGSAANYGDDERKLWLFKPSGGATSISMNFTSFSLENKYDYMFIYDGNSVNSTLIGKYTNTVTPGNINSTGPNLLIEFRSDCATTASGWAATYTTNAIVTPTTSTTETVVPTTLVSTVGTWKTANFTASFTDADNAGGSGLEKSYYQVIDFNGTDWRGNYTHGFFSDNFDVAIHPEWTQKTGTWGINSNALEQTDEVSTAAANTNIYAALTQTLSNRYLYNFKGKIDGTGTNRRAGFHFFVDKPDSSNRNNSYFVYFRLDNQKVQIYETTNNVFYLMKDTVCTLVANQWYDFKVIFDRTTGKIDVYQDNNNVATWTDPTPLPNGSYISFRSGNCKWSLDEIKVYRSRPTTSVTVSVGSGNANDVRYQNASPTLNSCKVKSIVNDVAGNLSSIYYHDVNIDWTIPSNIAIIKDGKAADINVVSTSDSLSANWSSSNDPNSAIARYWYSIGTSPGAVNTLTWTSNWGDTTVTAKNLVLVNGTTYYFNVKSENGAGLFSNVISTNGQTVTISSPTAPTAVINASNTVCAGQPIALADASAGSPTVWAWTMPGGTPASANSQNISVTYTANGIYTVSLTVSNATGTNTATKTITVSSNPIINLSASTSSICAGQSSTLSATGGGSYSWSPATNLSSSTGSVVIASPASSIVYTVVGTTGACTGNKTISLTVSPNPTVNITASSSSICIGQTSTLSSVGASSYSWSPVTNLSSSTGSLVVASPSSSIVYTVVGTTGLCSGSSIVSLTVNTCTGIQDLTSGDFISIYPNPFSDVLFVTLNLNTDTNIELVLFDVLGKEIMRNAYKESAGLSNKTIQLDNFNISNGVYWMKIKFNGQEINKKLIKN